MENKRWLAVLVLSSAVVAAAAWARLDTGAAAQVVAASAPAKAAVAAPAPDIRMKVSVDGGRLAIVAQGVPLGELLDAIDRSTGVHFESDGRAQEAVSMDAGPRPIRQAIESLLERSAYSYAWVEGAGGQGTRVLLVRRTASAPVPAPRPAAPAPVPDEAGMQQQQATDAMFEACKASACDSS